MVWGGAPAGLSAEGMPWKLPAIAAPRVRERCDRIYLATQRQARHLLAGVKPWSEDPELLLATESRSGEHWIRPNAGIVCGLSFLYRFGPYDETEVGLTRATVARLYKDGDEWKETSGFGRDDLLVLAKALDQAHTWIFEQKETPAEANAGSGS